MQLFLSLSLLTVIANAVAVPANHVVHEEREAFSRRWIKRDRVQPAAQFPVRIGLAQSNLNQAHDHLMDVAHPASPNYGKHWTAEQVIDMFKPSDETVNTVRQWLINAGFSNQSIVQSSNKAWLAFHASAKQMETLLHTEYHEYEDRRTGGVMPSCHKYHVPAEIQPHIDYITPGVKLMAPTEEDAKASQIARRASRQARLHQTHPENLLADSQDPNDLSNCDKQITPACVAALYQFPPAPSPPNPNNSMGIFEAELQYWDQVDLDLFFAKYTNIRHGTHPIDRNIDGGVGRTTNVSAAGGEAILDLQLAYPIVHPQAITVFNVDDIHYQTWANDTYNWGFNTLLDAIDGSYCTYSAYGETGNAPGIDPTYPDPSPSGYRGQLQCGVFKPTNVISVSYGGQEADVPIAYQKRQCQEYLKLGLQGVSFLFASGDAGVGNDPQPYGDDGPTGCLGPKDDIFNPTWPNTCPYITNVGATKVYPGHSVYSPESAVYDPAGHPYTLNYSSGGGFSNVFPIPDYQKSAVQTYFAQHQPPFKSYAALAKDAPNPTLPNVTALAGNTGGIYNRIGRGVPDVAANGDNIAGYTNGEFGLAGGTSASTPIFAAIVNRLNEERLAAGKGPVGFLNPTLYTHPEVLNDITNGTNKACQGLGFDAVTGWDPVTGLGTPNYPKMLKLFLSLP